ELRLVRRVRRAEGPVLQPVALPPRFDGPGVVARHVRPPAAREVSDPVILSTPAAVHSPGLWPGVDGPSRPKAGAMGRDSRRPTPGPFRPLPGPQAPAPSRIIGLDGRRPHRRCRRGRFGKIEPRLDIPRTDT